MELFQLISLLLSVETPPLSLSQASEDENVAEDAVEDNDEDENMDDVLEKLEKHDAEAKELLKEIMDLLSSIHRTWAASSLLMSHKLMFGSIIMQGCKYTNSAWGLGPIDGNNPICNFVKLQR